MAKKKSVEIEREVTVEADIYDVVRGFDLTSKEGEGKRFEVGDIVFENELTTDERKALLDAEAIKLQGSKQ